MKQKTYEFLRDAYTKVVQELLDDPTGSGLTQLELQEWYSTLVEVGEECNLDFWTVAEAEGTDYELKRFRAMLDHTR